MNFIPLVIAVFMLMMILYFAFAEIHQATLEIITVIILLSSLPILGITTYQYAFLNRNSFEKKWVWELGCVNSGIWTVIFLGIFIYQIIVKPSNSFVPLASFVYFGYLFFLNQKMAEFMKVEK